MTQQGVCRLKFVRSAQFADWLRSYKIFVNDNEVGTLARNSVLEVEVPSGPLTIQARIDWGRSEPLVVEAAPKQRIEMQVSNHWGAWRALWAVTFGARSYLELKQLPAS